MAASVARMASALWPPKSWGAASIYARASFNAAMAVAIRGCMARSFCADSVQAPPQSTAPNTNPDKNRIVPLQWDSSRRRAGEAAIDAGNTSSQCFAVQLEQAAPRLLGLRFVVNLRIRGAPAMCDAGIHFDLRGQVRLGKRLFQDVLLVGGPHVVVGRDCDEELRLGLGGLQMR